MKFRQAIRPGDVGTDVTAVKRAYIKMGVKGSGALAVTRRAGTQFVEVTKTVELQHRLKADGVYGESVHKIVSPYFDAYGAALYLAATIRHPLPPPPPLGDAQALAKRLLKHAMDGSYTADNPGDLRDITATADGKPVWSQAGRWIHIDARPLRLLCWLIEDQGVTVGTFALCSDHHDDGPNGHAGGLAVDLSTLNGFSVASSGARPVTLDVAKMLRSAPNLLRPRQLICGGYGNHRDTDISNCSIPAADSFYGSAVMAQHTNHLHCGY